MSQKAQRSKRKFDDRRLLERERRRLVARRVLSERNERRYFDPVKPATLRIEERIEELTKKQAEEDEGNLQKVRNAHSDTAAQES